MPANEPIQKLEWFAYRDLSPKPWRVFLVDKVVSVPNDEEEDGEPAEALDGITHFDIKEIHVLASLPPRTLYETTFHEIQHSAGGPRKNTPRDAEAEEKYIRRSEKRLWLVFRQFGAMFPPLPDGFRFKRKRKRKAAE